MQKSNVVSFLLGVLVTTSVFYGFGIGGVGDGGQGFIFKRPVGGDDGGAIALQNQNNYDGQVIGGVVPTERSVSAPERNDNQSPAANPVQRVPQKGLGDVRLPAQDLNIPQPDGNAAAVSTAKNAFWGQINALSSLHANYFERRSWLITDFCHDPNAAAKKTRLLNSVNTIGDAISSVQRAGGNDGTFANGANLANARTAISSISLSLMNIEEIIDGVPNACVPPMFKYAAFPRVSARVSEDLRADNQWRDQLNDAMIYLGYNEVLRGAIPQEPINEVINETFAALEDAF